MTVYINHNIIVTILYLIHMAYVVLRLNYLNIFNNNTYFLKYIFYMILFVILVLDFEYFIIIYLILFMEDNYFS